ncbi:7089_t:CDS:2 [Racocetra fulgida]|uniref:7089_t:CDS:1 n=1 Tax=Racocetra fulgida TaxID=60492 RepID=A0A9N9A1I5_9GLOM|nr:7089_t:CDS:2 [Racocetra fulgida]
MNVDDEQTSKYHQQKYKLQESPEEKTSTKKKLLRQKELSLKAQNESKKQEQSWNEGLSTENERLENRFG